MKLGTLVLLQLEDEVNLHLVLLLFEICKHVRGVHTGSKDTRSLFSSTDVYIV